MRSLKTLGLIVVAICGMGSIAVPAAMATPEFTAPFDPLTYEHPSEASIHATQLGEGHEFAAGFATVECSTTTFTGTPTATDSSTQTVDATYSGCKANPGELTTHVNMNGCEYLFHAIAETAEGKYSATADLLCPTSEGPTLTITTSGGTTKCIFHIEPDQEELNGTVEFREVEGEMEVEVSLQEIDYISTGGFFNCGVTNGTHANATYQGNTTVTASEGETSLYLQMSHGDLKASVTSFKKKVGELQAIELTSKGGNKLKIVGERIPPMLKLETKSCNSEMVPCKVEVKCTEPGKETYTAKAYDVDKKKYTNEVYVDGECT